MYTATPLDNEGMKEQWHESPNGLACTVWYKVDTGEPSRIYTDAISGLPVRGSSYPGIASLKVINIRAERWAGREITGSRVGWCKVQVDYAEPGAAGGGSRPDLVAGTKWSEVQFSTTGQNVYYDVDPGPGPKEPIANGRGVNRLVGQVEFIVQTYMPLATTVPVALLNTLGLKQAFNDAPISIPPVWGATSPFLFAAGEAQFGGWRPDVIGKLWKINVWIRAGLRREYEWYREDNLGRSTGAKVLTPIYELASFVGVPGIS